MSIAGANDSKLAADVKNTTSFALSRVESLLARTYVIAAAALSTELVQNAFEQQQHLNQAWFWFSLCIIMGSLTGIFISAFTELNPKPWYLALCLSTLLTVFIWPLQVAGLESGEHITQPWIWWAIGFTAIASAGVFRLTGAIIYLLLLPTSWVFMRLFFFGGFDALWRILQDATYAFLFSTALVTLVLVLRRAAQDTDAANDIATRTSAERARIDAIERERGRVNAMVHDSVLTTLLVASTAEDDKDAASAVELAELAIARFDQEVKRDPAVEQQISVSSFFTALQDSIERQAPVFKFDISGASSEILPTDIAEALTEATIQAVHNSVQHAGGATEREVIMRATKRGVKIVIRDNGRGFRPSRVAKSRLGIKLSIFGRIETAGGKAYIDSRPGAGTSVILEWAAK